MEVSETDGAVAEVEPGTTWREALSAWVRPADRRVTDEEIFTILNGGTDDAAVAELCAAKGVTLPMYCLWKSKYRQLDLEQLRQARRSEQRRLHASIGAVVLIATLFTAGVTVGLGWAVSSAFGGLIGAPSASTAQREPRQDPSSASEEPRPVIGSGSESSMADPPSLATAAASVTETGYRIQVTAAESDQEGRALVAQLAAKGYPAYMTRATVGNKSVVRVRVGPFDTLPAAEEVVDQLRSAGYEGVWIAR